MNDLMPILATTTNQPSLMKRIQYLHLTLQDELPPHQLSGLRGAIAHKAGWEHTHFHNHDGQKDKYLYRYPLIQYKAIRRQPSLLCLEDAVQSVQALFLQPDREVEVNGRPLSLKIERMDMRHYTLQTWSQLYSFRIRNWIGLNQKNYRIYQELNSEKEKIQLLERCLVGSILSFSSGLGWFVEQPIRLKITSLPQMRRVKYKGISVLGFSFTFRCNIYLPLYVGLGKGVSLGYGIVYPANRPQSATPEEQRSSNIHQPESIA